MLEDLFFLFDLFDEESSFLENFLEDQENPLNKIKAYLDKYRFLYSSSDRHFLEAEMFDVYSSMMLHDVLPPSIFASIMLHCGVLPDKFNYYAKIFENMKMHYKDLYNKSILDIGCGQYPAFVEMIAKEMRDKKSKALIDGVDPRLIIKTLEEFENTKLSNTAFTTRTNVDNYDILMGVLPCEATEAIITKACNEEKEMLLVPCTCLHPINGKHFRDSFEYIHYLKDLTAKKKSSSFECALNSFSVLDGDMAILNLVRK